MKKKEENKFKYWIDIFLIFNLALVFIEFMFFFIAVISEYFGSNYFIFLVQKLWKPFFIPTITILISASLFEGLVNWWKKKELDQVLEK